MRALVIVPAHNEAASLPKVLAELSSYSSRYDVLVVDDASTDDTADVARRFPVSVICLPANLGIGGAVQTGFKYAVRKGYEIAVQLDGDGQHDPAWLGAVTEPIRSRQAECAIGSRYLKESRHFHYKTALMRRVGMIFSSTLLSWITRLRITDTTSGFRALHRSAFAFFAENYPVDHPDAEALLMLHLAGFRICEVPVSMRPRQGGRSSINWIRASVYPIRILVGFTCALLENVGRLKWQKF